MNAGTVTPRNWISRFVEPVVDHRSAREESPRYLSESERVKIANGAHAAKSARKITAELGRAVTATDGTRIRFCTSVRLRRVRIGDDQGSVEIDHMKPRVGVRRSHPPSRRSVRLPHPVA